MPPTMMVDSRRVVHSSSPAPAPVTTTPKRREVTRDEVIEAIIREATTGRGDPARAVRCDVARANRTIQLFGRAARNANRPYYLSDAELDIDGGPHDVMDVIVPDTERGATELHPLVDGSAEDLLTRFLLPGGTHRFVHTSDYTEGIRHCVVALRAVQL